MDSLRLGKGNTVTDKQTSGGASKQPAARTSVVPFAIRFNAGEQTIQEVLPQQGAACAADNASECNDDDGRNSMSSSPQLSSDDFSWRKEFLQNNFFQRKRTESVDTGGSGAAASPSVSILNNHLLSTSATADPNTLGTWKLIKGKVSQAMEDIKSKKETCSSTVMPLAKDDNNFDSEQETSEDVSVDLSNSNAYVQQETPAATTACKTSLESCSVYDSDFDADTEILDYDSSQVLIPTVLVTKRTSSPPRTDAHLLTKSSPSPTKSSPSPLVTSASVSKQAAIDIESSSYFRRRRKTKPTTGIKSSSVTSSPSKLKKDVEIESGVEMLEDMILPISSSSSNFTPAIGSSERCKLDAGSNRNDSNKYSAADGGRYGDDRLPSMQFLDNKIHPVTNTTAFMQFNQQTSPTSTRNNNSEHLKLLLDQRARSTVLQLFYEIYACVLKSRSIIVALVLLFVLTVIPLSDFLCGIFVCLFTISLMSLIMDICRLLLDQTSFVSRLIGMNGNGPERTPFAIPDYKGMPICEVPAVEEHKPLKSYAGWMNEINSYDPSNYHISMTRPVYVRLDGTFLQVFDSNVRVPKRAMWNEPSIHRKNVTFKGNRRFNLLGCRVEMCPRGLARKRHFSRKYPIQLIINTAKMMDEGNYKVIETTNPTKQDLSAVYNANHDYITIDHQNSNDSNEDQSEGGRNIDFDFGTVVLQSNLQRLHDRQQTTSNATFVGDDTTIPYGDETRLLLFARCDREKEDWYRRFHAASVGNVDDQEIIHNSNVTNDDNADEHDSVEGTIKNTPTDNLEEATNSTIKENKTCEARTHQIEELAVASNAARISGDFLKFMSLYQSLNKIPPVRSYDQSKQNRRDKKQQDDLWKGIDSELFINSSTNAIWANVIIGRILYSCLHDQTLLMKIQDLLQKKLSAIKLPGFMEDVVIAQTDLGDSPPIIHRVSQPLLDERGVWIDADVTYEGLMHMTITTKLNLLRLKRQQVHPSEYNGSGSGGVSPASDGNPRSVNNDKVTPSNGSELSSGGGGGVGIIINSSTAGDPSTIPSTTTVTSDVVVAAVEVNSAIYDSDAESSGATSSESESNVIPPNDLFQEQPPSSATISHTGPGSSRRFLRIVDRITASNFFQSATEIPYIQRAMENMSTKITLKVELKGLVARVVLNLPPPPSDRMWIAFRGPPRLWISAKPAVGDHTFDWSVVTNVIESKLCDEVYKYLVYPNMVDIIAPFLGQSTYKE